jgi:hypothetical protein
MPLWVLPRARRGPSSKYAGEIWEVANSAASAPAASSIVPSGLVRMPSISGPPLHAGPRPIVEPGGTASANVPA